MFLGLEGSRSVLEELLLPAVEHRRPQACSLTQNLRLALCPKGAVLKMAIDEAAFFCRSRTGHWMRDRGQIAFGCSQKQIESEWTTINPETRPNQFASDLLLLTKLFVPLAKGQLPFWPPAWNGRLTVGEPFTSLLR